MLNLPIPVQYTNDFPILQYADDTLVIMEGCGRQLFILKALLNTFVASRTKSEIFKIHDGPN